MNIKHASFDVWNTLITPNPEYAKARNALLAMVLGLSSEHAKFMYTHVKKYADSIAEMNGTQIHNDDLYELLVSHANMNASTKVWLNLRDDFRRLFKQLPPTIDPLLVEGLKDLRALGCTISIGSNTNFIEGRIMRDVVFDHLNIPFDFMLFSDEEECAKPHPEFFGSMLRKVEKLHPGIDPQYIAHVGDSQRADVYGATNVGMLPLYVTDPRDTLTVVTNLKALFFHA